MAEKTFQNRMMSLFGIKSAKDGVRPDSKGRPPKGGLNHKSNIAYLFEWFLRENLDTSESVRNRELRYSDLDIMVRNDTIIQMAADLYADEAVQCENSGYPVRVKAKAEVQSYIEGLLELWGYTQPVVREIIYSKVVYGDGFDSNRVIPKEGIVGVTPLSIRDVRDRLEFNPSKTLESLRSLEGTDGRNKNQKLRDLMGDLEDADSDPTAVFQKFLFGFELSNGLIVPPWTIGHYRGFSLQEEFAPWGRSRFINSLSTFRQLLAAKGMMQVARGASFPRDVWKVITDPGMGPTEKWEAVEEFQEYLDNAGYTEGTKETPSIGSRLIYPEGLAEYQQETNSLDLNNIADVEFLRDDEIMSTFVPKGYLIVDKANFGNSGQSLLQQFKPFGRRVFSDQSDFLATVTEKIKTHLVMVNKFEGWDTPFELLMDFPVIEESDDRLSHKSSELSLASSAIDTIKSMLGVQKVPKDVIKDALRLMSFLPPEKIDSWTDSIAKENEGSDNSMFEKVRNRFDEKSRDLFVEESIRIKARHRKLEGVADKQHYINSLQNSRKDMQKRLYLEAAVEDGDRTLREYVKKK